MKKLFFIFLCMLIGLTNQPTYTMQAAAGRTAGQIVKHYTKKGFSGFMSTISWTIATIHCFGTAAIQARTLLKEDQIAQNLKKVDEWVTNFIKEEMNALSPDHPLNDVKIIQTPFFSNKNPENIAVLGYRHIVLTEETEKKIKQALKDNDIEELDKWRSVLQHENEHRNNHDIVKNMVADVITPFITHGSLKIVRNALPIAKSFWREQLLKIPAALAKSDINTVLTTIVYRNGEINADEGVKNDRTSLNGMKKFLTDTEEQTNELYRTPFFYLSEKNYQHMRRYYIKYTTTHPLPEERIKRINNRIDDLEKEKWNQHIQEVRENYHNLINSSNE